jgi:hypothetical protein
MNIPKFQLFLMIIRSVMGKRLLEGELRDLSAIRGHGRIFPVK